MSVSCSHGSFSLGADIAEASDCQDCRLARIERLLVRIAEAVEASNVAADEVLEGLVQQKEREVKALEEHVLWHRGPMQ